MKKEVKKFDLVKISGAMVLLTVLLTWIIPQGTFSGTEMQIGEITRIGIFDFFTYGLLGMYYFTVLVTFIFVLGGFYQVLSRIGGYQALITKLAKIFKKKEILFALLVSFIFTAISAVTNEYILLLAVVPFIMSIMKEMKFDKISTFATTVGSILVGTIGSMYSTKIVGINVQQFGIEYSTLWYIKLIILLLAFILFNVFNILHLRKTQKNKESEPMEDVFEPANVTKKKTIWPAATLLIIFAIISIMAYFPWEEVFEIKWFSNALKIIQEYKLFDSTIFAYILGEVKAFGSWDIFGIQALMIITTLLLKWIYKLSFDDFLESFGEGLKKSGKLVVLLLICYLVLEFTVMYPIVTTIVDWFISLSDKFNVVLTTISGLFTSLFTVEYQYTVSLIGAYLKSSFADNVNQIAIILQTTFGLASMIAPSSAILMMGLSLCDIKFKDWLKYIWKFVLIMLVVLVLIMLFI